MFGAAEAVPAEGGHSAQVHQAERVAGGEPQGGRAVGGGRAEHGAGARVARGEVPACEHDPVPGEPAFEQAAAEHHHARGGRAAGACGGRDGERAGLLQGELRGRVYSL